MGGGCSGGHKGVSHLKDSLFHGQEIERRTDMLGGQGRFYCSTITAVFDFSIKSGKLFE